MAWYNPSTWSVVDKIQGQNNKPAAEPDMSSIYNQNPSAVRYSIGGTDYNYAGDPIKKPELNNTKYSDAYDKALKDALASLNSSRTPVPRFINYDIGASWNKAREEATKAVSPIYQQKMTDFINRQQQELVRKQEDTVSGKSGLDLALERLRGDTALQRTRTSEDASTNIADINATQAYTARNEGLNFDAANRALNENLGATGLADTGLGQQQVQETQMARRDMSNEQVRQTDNKIEATNTLMNRTFQDLEIKDTRAGEDTQQSKQKIDLDLERFIQDQAFEKDQTGKQLELEKAADIASKQIGVQKQLVDQWIASLSGQGYTAQEIANAASIYG